MWIKKELYWYCNFIIVDLVKVISVIDLVNMNLVVMVMCVI